MEEMKKCWCCSRPADMEFDGEWFCQYLCITGYLQEKHKYKVFGKKYTGKYKKK